MIRATALVALPDLPLGVILGVYTNAMLLPPTSAISERPPSHSAVVIPLAPHGSR